MLPQKGTFTASDNWSMDWALNRTPQTIRYYKPGSIQDSVISGTIDQAFLERKLRQFKNVHHWEQLSLFEMEPIQ